MGPLGKCLDDHRSMMSTFSLSLSRRSDVQPDVDHLFDILKLANFYISNNARAYALTRLIQYEHDGTLTPSHCVHIGWIGCAPQLFASGICYFITTLEELIPDEEKDGLDPLMASHIQNIRMLIEDDH